jgi:hypothetical protein
MLMLVKKRFVFLLFYEYSLRFNNSDAKVVLMLKS